MPSKNQTWEMTRGIIQSIAFRTTLQLSSPSQTISHHYHRVCSVQFLFSIRNAFFFGLIFNQKSLLILSSYKPLSSMYVNTEKQQLNQIHTTIFFSFSFFRYTYVLFSLNTVSWIMILLVVSVCSFYSLISVHLISFVVILAT